MQASFDNQPLRYYKGHPLYLTAYLTAALAAAVAVFFLFDSAGFPLTAFFVFSPQTFLHGFIWQPLTYVLFNPLNFFTPFLLLCFWSWGAEIEMFFGRRRYLAVLGSLIATPVVFRLAIYGLQSRSVGYVGGIYYLVCGLLVAYATLYPNLEYFGGWIPLKWFAFVSIACGSLISFPDRDWIGLLELWLDCFVGFACVQFARGNFTMPNLHMPALRPKPKFRVLHKPVSGSSRIDLDEPDSEMDRLLDKIAKSGMASLTDSERTELEKARQALLKK